MIDIREHGGIYADGGGGGGGTSAGANIPGNTTGNIYGFKEDEEMSPYLKNSIKVMAGETIKKGDVIICNINNISNSDKFYNAVVRSNRYYSIIKSKLHYHDFKNEEYREVDVPGVSSVNRMNYVKEFNLLILDRKHYFIANGVSLTPASGPQTEDDITGRIYGDQVLVKKTDNVFELVKLENASSSSFLPWMTWPSDSGVTGTLKISGEQLLDSFMYNGKFLYIYTANANSPSSGGWPIFGLVGINFESDGTPKIVKYYKTFFGASYDSGKDTVNSILGQPSISLGHKSIYYPDTKNEKMRGTIISNGNGEFVALSVSVLGTTRYNTNLFTGNGKYSDLDNLRVATPLTLKGNDLFRHLQDGNHFVMPPYVIADDARMKYMVYGYSLSSDSNRKISDSSFGNVSNANVKEPVITGIAMENASQGSLVRIQRIW